MRGRTTVLAAPGRVELQEFEIPAPQPGAIVAETIRSNICGSEVHIWKGEHPSVRFGSVLGHETLLRVASLGAGVATDNAGQPLHEGDRIACTYFQICRRCPACQIGKWNLCVNGYRHWSELARTAPHFHGTLGSHYYVNPDQYVYKVPEGVADASAASANCALSQLMYGLDQAGVSLGETVLIQGAGGLGLCGIAVARERGARVLVVEGVPGRLEQARRFGAHELIDLATYATSEARRERVLALTGGVGPDVVVDVTGVADVFSEGATLTRPGGRFLEMGAVWPNQTTVFDPGALTRRGVTILPIIRYDPWFLKRSLDFLSAYGDRYPFAGLTDGEYTLEDVNQALRDSAERRVTRATIVCEPA